MGRDKAKNKYFEVGFEKDSWVLDRIADDARFSHMTGTPSKLLAMRLIEYYTLVEKGLIIPGASMRMSPMEPPVPQAVPAMPTAMEHADVLATQRQTNNDPDPITEAPPPPPVLAEINEEDAGDNADMALDFFLDDDDDDDDDE
jgi:hypothetical protein